MAGLPGSQASCYAAKLGCVGTLGAARQTMVDKRTESFLSAWSACPDPACALAEGGRIICANAAWETLIGRARGAIVDLASPDNREELARHIRHLDAGRAVSFEAHLSTARGEARAFSLRAWHAADGPVLIAVARSEADIEGAWRSQRILDGAPTYVVVLDAKGDVLDMNRTMLEATGYTRDEVTGRAYMPMFVPADEHGKLVAVLEEEVRTGQHQVSENHVLTRDGQKILVEWHGKTLLDAQGKPEYAYGVGFEVGERQRMRRALLRSEQRLALNFHQAPIGMIEWTTDFRVTDWNPVAERVFGYSRDEMLGRPGDILVPEPIRPMIMDIWTNILATTGGQHSINENITKDGRVIMCEWHNAPLVDEAGEVVGVASLIADVTERHRAETELRERERAQAVTIEQLSAPVIDVWEGILALPVIGAVDEARAARMTESLLLAIVQGGAAFTIVDLTGVTAMDAATAAHITNMVRAAGLLGTRCLISGIRPAMARSLVELDATLGVETFGTLRAALRRAIEASVARRRR
ncbi:PAS domain S-box protein [Polyangium aurulentum]|uniref:PAS domain S-box protein n=1 Tax=Polyangium aurulentum TaxID=2567896 RepID=UPI0010AE3CEE|nr:PAS domain S-box protein [Polyangium aurulentum]UQA58462.1 PAS domain S-box protein [Polyangium aurulentum]